ncbi:DMP19 family protein [Roseibium sediminis]|uniref:DMP19 family protein n=1 Tax=Roseibium sediminis TaxID=1775174 RepID=UPI001375887E|nr:DUF4375 domain-containing protein [Roseibium sediminis]
MTTFLAALAVSGQSAYPAPVCPEPDKVYYPMTKLLKTEGLLLDSDVSISDISEYGSASHVRKTRETVLGKLDGKSQAERDALLLSRLAWETNGSYALLLLATGPEAGLYEIYIEVLDRAGLVAHADALRAVKAAFPNWNFPPRERYYQWSDGSGTIRNLKLDAELEEQSRRFNSAQPDLLETAQKLIEGDGSYDDYSAKLRAIDEYSRFDYLLWQIASCVPDWESPDEALHALATLPQALADLHVFHLMFLEGGNGGFHQYLYNSSGTFAPELIETLRRYNLDEHADAVEKVMPLLSQKYPRDTEQRRSIMHALSEATNEELNAPTWIVDDRLLFEAFIKRAKSDGYWPR